jgi:CRP/FNR family cyclic AMP-dependent transcriptional regulator
VDVCDVTPRQIQFRNGGGSRESNPAPSGDLFQDLTPAELQPIADSLQPREYKRGDYVFRAGDPAEFLYILSTGQIKYFVTTVKGDEFVLEVLTPGAVFGEPGLFAPELNRVVDALAMESSTVQEMRRARLLDIMQSHPPVMMRMLEGLATESRFLVVKTINDVAYAEIRARVVRKILELATAHGQERQDGSMEIMLSVSQTTMAGMVGATRENVNRALGTLAADGDVQVVGGRLVIADPARLRQQAEGGVPLLHRRNRPDENGAGESRRR